MIELDAKAFTAAVEGNAHNVAVFLSRGASAEALSKSTLLVILAERGLTQVIEVLLDAGANPNDRILETGGTPLMSAAREGHLSTVYLLVNRGAEIDVFSDGVYGANINALMYASLKGHLEVVDCLLEYGADVNARYKEGTTALMWAARSGHLPIMQRLVEAGAELNTVTKSNITALRGAKKHCHAAVVEWLVAMGAKDIKLSRGSQFQDKIQYYVGKFNKRL